jgi:hypothetical protein
MENVLFKISYPAEFHAQTAVEAAAILHEHVKNRLDDIKEIKKSANTIFRIRNKKEKDRVNYALFEIDNKTYVPQSIEIIYSQSLDDLTSSFIKKKKVVEENPVMVITYQNFEYLKKINPDEYDFNAFLSIDKKNNAVLTKKYSSYKLINYLKNRS